MFFFLLLRRPPSSPPFPSTTLFRSFCMLFLYPLLLQAWKDVPFQPWLRGSLEGITPQEVPRREERARRSEEHTSELQSRRDLVCRLLLEKKKSIKERPPLPTALAED